MGTFTSRCCRTYAGHEFEDAGLGLIEQSGNLIQAGNHLGVFSYSTGHAASKRITQVMVNVELAWRTGSEESIVQAWTRVSFS